MQVISIIVWILPLTAATLSDCPVKLKADIYILCDASGSIAHIGWTRLLRFVASVIGNLTLGPDATQVAFGIFSGRFKHVFDLNRSTDQKELSKIVLSTRQLKHDTSTHLALNAIFNEGYLTSKLHGARRRVPSVLVVITDGRSDNKDETLSAAKRLRDQGITIFGIGVGLTDKSEILGIAGSQQNVFDVRSFNALGAVRDRLIQRVSEASFVQCPSDFLLDVAFVIESDGDIGAENYYRYFEFIENFLNSFTVSENSTKIGLYIHESVPEFFVPLTGNKDVFDQKIHNISYDTNIAPVTADNQHSLTAEILATTSFAVDGRYGVQDVLVILTNDVSRFPGFLPGFFRYFKDVTVFVVAMTPAIDTQPLEMVATKDEYVVLVNDDCDLIGQANVLAAMICDANGDDENE